MATQNVVVGHPSSELTPTSVPSSSGKSMLAIYPIFPESLSQIFQERISHLSKYLKKNKKELNIGYMSILEAEPYLGKINASRLPAPSLILYQGDQAKKIIVIGGIENDDGKYSATSEEYWSLGVLFDDAKIFVKRVQEQIDSISDR